MSLISFSWKRFEKCQLDLLSGEFTLACEAEGKEILGQLRPSGANFYLWFEGAEPRKGNLTVGDVIFSQNDLQDLAFEIETRLYPKKWAVVSINPSPDGFVAKTSDVGDVEFHLRVSKKNGKPFAYFLGKTVGPENRRYVRSSMGFWLNAGYLGREILKTLVHRGEDIDIISHETCESYRLTKERRFKKSLYTVKTRHGDIKFEIRNAGEDFFLFYEKGSIVGPNPRRYVISSTGHWILEEPLRKAILNRIIVPDNLEELSCNDRGFCIVKTPYGQVRGRFSYRNDDPEKPYIFFLGKCYVQSEKVYVTTDRGYLVEVSSKIREEWVSRLKERFSPQEMNRPRVQTRPGGRRTGRGKDRKLFKELLKQTNGDKAKAKALYSKKKKKGDQEEENQNKK